MILVVVEEVAVVVVVVLVAAPGTGSSSHLFTSHPVLTVCTFILVFVVCLFESSAPIKSAPAFTQDGGSRHIQTGGQIAEVIQMLWEQAGPPDMQNDALSSDAQLRFNSSCVPHASRSKDVSFCIVAWCS